MHYTEQVPNFRFTHGPFACVAFALNDRLDPVLGRDEVNTVVALTPRPPHRVAKITETLAAPFLEPFRGQLTQLSLGACCPLARQMCAEDVAPPQSEDRSRHQGWHPQLPKTVDQEADEVGRRGLLEQT